MADTAIRIEGLGKKYRLGRRSQGRQYVSLRDVMSDAARGVGARVLSMGDRFKGAHAGPQVRASPNSIKNGPADFWALRNITFDVKRGAILGIIGANGAGKSTLLKILSRITEPTEGTLRLRGRVASLLEVGTGFHPELTGRENIFLNGALLGMRRAEIAKKFDEIVAFAEIGKFLDTPVKRYSSGMYVRAAFAVAAHLEPEILIIDEVLAVGDAEFQQKCTGKLRSVAAHDGRTVLFVSHQLGLVRDLCEEAILLKNGSFAQRGPADEVIQTYLSALAGGHAQAIQSKYIESVKPAHGLKSSSLFFGESLSIDISLHSLPDVSIGINLAIRNGAGRLICLFSTNPHDGVQLPREATFRVTFTLNPCNLAPGDYFIDLAITEPAIVMLEEVQAAFSFQVYARPIGGTWAYESRYGDVFPSHQWFVHNEAEEHPGTLSGTRLQSVTR